MVKPFQPRANVLVIDDMATYRQIIGHLLAKNNFQAVTAGNVETALKDFANMRFGLVITDIFMPGMGGIAGIQRMRERWPQVKIIAISGGWKTGEKGAALMAARKIGADAALPKPFPGKDLVEAIAGLGL